MPINYSKYPPNWKTEIRPRILKRADNRCECCGLKNKAIVYSFIENGIREWKEEISQFDFDFFEPKEVKVILTIAHLDHDETNLEVKDDRLKAMCQLCHLRYDAKEKSKRKKLKNIKC